MLLTLYVVKRDKYKGNINMSGENIELLVFIRNHLNYTYCLVNTGVLKLVFIEMKGNTGNKSVWHRNTLGSW